MTTELFASGQNARVYRVDKSSVRAPFSRADVFREEQDSDPQNGLVLFCQFKLLNIAFPGQFPEMVAYRSEPKSPKAHIERGGMLSYEPPFFLYSKLTDTPSEHIQFSNHIRIDEFGYKTRTCECEKCTKHAQVHDLHRHSMFSFVLKMKEVGVELPFDDPTDWCVNSKGEIVFYEFNSFDVLRFSNYLATQNFLAEQQLQISKLLNALSKLTH